MNIIESEILFKKEYSQNWPCYKLEPIGENKYELEITFPLQEEMLITTMLFKRFSTIDTEVINGNTIILS